MSDLNITKMIREGFSMTIEVTSQSRVVGLMCSRLRQCFAIKLHQFVASVGVVFILGLVPTESRGQFDERPMTRLRPITASSAVDRFFSHRVGSEISPAHDSREVVRALDDSSTIGAVRTATIESIGANEANARYAARMQFQLPPGSPTAPPTMPSDSGSIPPPSLGPSATSNPGGLLPSGPTLSTPIPNASTVAPMPGTQMPGTQMPPAGATMVPRAVTSPNLSGAASPRGLPMGPMTTYPPMTPSLPGTGNLSSGNLSSGNLSSGDLQPLAPPQLTDHFATIDNCSCVSPPSSYVAATGWQTPVQPIGGVPEPGPAYLAPTTPVMSPVATATPVPPIADASNLPKGSGVPRHSLLNFGQTRNPIVVGQGIIGQPVAYVPGQPIRNWIRYLFP